MIPIPLSCYHYNETTITPTEKSCQFYRDQCASQTRPEPRLRAAGIELPGGCNPGRTRSRTCLPYTLSPASCASLGAAKHLITLPKFCGLQLPCPIESKLLPLPPARICTDAVPAASRIFSPRVKKVGIHKQVAPNPLRTGTVLSAGPEIKFIIARVSGAGVLEHHGPGKFLTHNRALLVTPRQCMIG